MPFLFGIEGCHFFCSKDCWNKWLNSHTTEQERAENVNIGVSVAKGNADLQKMLDDYLKTMTEADFNKIMNEAIGFQPEI